jgi:ribosome-associated toxin RatA of RatAB toxin-antitoxin module
MDATRWVFVLGLAAGLSGCGATATSANANWAGRPKLQKLKEVPRVIEQAKAETTMPAPSPTDRNPVTEAIPIERTELVRGRSTVVVDAPFDKVKSSLLRYGKYAEFMPHYSQSKILGRAGKGHEVYMQVEALHGAVKMWAKLEMTPRKDGNVELLESKFVDGNVKDFRAIWRLEPIDADHTKLTLEVFLYPTLPLPTNVLNDENVQGAEKGVTAMRKRIEGG